MSINIANDEMSAESKAPQYPDESDLDLNVEEHLNPTRLQENPVQYLELLKRYNNANRDIQSVINQKPYVTWFSNAALSLVFLAGQINSDEDDNIENHEWYGS